MSAVGSSPLVSFPAHILLSLDVFIPSLPSIATNFSVPVASTQLVMTGFLVGVACGQLFGGPISDIMGRRKPLLAGLLLYSVAMLLGSLSPSLTMLALARAVAGFGAGVVEVARQATIRDRPVGSAKSRMFSQRHCCFVGSPSCGRVT